MRPLWTADELVQATGGVMPRPFAVSGISIDTRSLAPGDLFVALAGEHRDGHDFVADALARGAAGALVHRDVPDLRALRVDDTLAALHRLGGFSRARLGGRLVAVTGSVGKTTTKEMLRAGLAAQGATHAAEASYNNHWGVPLTLARMPADAAFCVCEIGMNHPGEIAPLARLARPHVAVITALERTHVGHLGSIEAIVDEKATIMRGVEPGGTVVLPADSVFFARLRDAAGALRTMGFGASPQAGARLVGVELDAEGSDMRVEIGGAKFALRIGAPGRHMAMNALAALAAIDALGADVAIAARALGGFAPLAGRGARRVLHVSGGEALLLDESYNASAASVRAALAVLRLQPDRRRMAVLGDMLELGAEGPSEHRGLASEIVACADTLFACGPLMRHLFDAIPARLRGAYAMDAAALAPLVEAAIRPGDVILVKGSLGSRMKQVVAALERAEVSG